MSPQIFFKDGGDGLSSVKYTCTGDGIVAAAAGDGNWDGSFSADAARDGSVADDAAGYRSVDAATWGGSEVGCTGVSSVLGTGVDGALRLWPLLFLLLNLAMFTMVILSE